jgi:biopolymer transport protein ExbD
VKRLTLAPVLLFSFVVLACTGQSGVETSQSTEVGANELVSEAIVVTIDSDQKIWIDGEIVDQQTLRPALERLHAANPEWTLVIHADTASPPFSAMMMVMLAADSVGIRSGLEGVSIAEIE